jgi:hypothetical protein
LAQPDCHVYSAPGSFAAAHHGIAWVNQLVSQYGQNHWCLYIDADECLVYPHCEHVSLPRFCEYLQRSGADGVYSILLDMYSDKPIATSVYRPGQPFLDVCSYFDGDYRFRRRSGLAPFPSHEFIGGPRLRCFFPEYTNAGWLSRNIPKVTRLVRSRVGVLSDAWSIAPPMLIKIPLIRGGRAQWLTNHKTTPIELADVHAALLHFKYFSDFHDRVAVARSERQHFDAGSEYARYEAALAQTPDLSFYWEGSVRYRQSHDLVRYGYLIISDAYQRFSREETRGSSDLGVIADDAGGYGGSASKPSDHLDARGEPDRRLQAKQTAASIARRHQSNPSRWLSARTYLRRPGVGLAER